MIYIGNNEILNIYIGTDKIYGIYAGDLQIYPTDINILTAISLENLVWVTNVPASGGTATKDNCTYSVTAYYSDGTTSDVTSEATITGSQVIPSTNIGEVHSAGTLTLTAEYSGFTATGNVTVYQEAATSDFSTKPLTFNILSDGTINWVASSSDIAKTIDYKLNNGEWVSITSNTGSSAPTITVNSGDKIQFRGNNATYATFSFSFRTFLYNSFSGSTALFEVEGNIMSLIYGDDFKNKLTISSSNTFYGLFKECVNLVSAENLILPATTLATYCYSNMFEGCTSLTTAPELPATDLANLCYMNMFDGCTSLTTAPELPATTLANYCYASMFNGCTSLTTAPELPVTTLANYCYRSMFSNCTSLTKAPVLPSTTLADYCYSQMFWNCTSLTTAPALPATTLKKFCYEYMFYGCSSLTVAPELPANVLTEDCYVHMFNSCTSLNYIKCLATNISAPSCTNYWVQGVAPTGTFVKNPNMTSWKTGINGIPTGWTVQDA